MQHEDAKAKLEEAGQQALVWGRQLESSSRRGSRVCGSLVGRLLDKARARLRASWKHVTRLWHQQITIDTERWVETPARPGAKSVVKLAKYAGRVGHRNANKKQAQLWL